MNRNGMPSAIIQLSVLAAASILAGQLAYAQDARRGQLLYENHCRECHEDGVHFRENRKATNFDELTAFIAQWVTELQLNWTAEELADVRLYLNERFYRFDE